MMAFMIVLFALTPNKPLAVKEALTAEDLDEKKGSSVGLP